jgi:hypothetical protein
MNLRYRTLKLMVIDPSSYLLVSDLNYVSFPHLFEFIFTPNILALSRSSDFQILAQNIFILCNSVLVHQRKIPAGPFLNPRLSELIYHERIHSLRVWR